MTALSRCVKKWSRSLVKSRQMRLEGDLHPFMAHLQYFKDLLALPRVADKAAA